MSNIKIYNNNPTAGGTDGNLVSSTDGSNPIISDGINVPESGYQEGEWIKLAVRCDEYYKTVEQNARHARLTIEDSNHVDKWQLAPDDNGAAGTPEDWGQPLDINVEIVNENHIFWTRARAHETEGPVNDASVGIEVGALISAQ